MDTGPWKDVLRGHETFEEAIVDPKIATQIAATLYMSTVLARLAEAIEKMPGS